MNYGAPPLPLHLSCGMTPLGQVSLCHLVVLSLKSCKLRQLGDDVAELVCLKELYLETNLILSLPHTFTRLRTLEVTTLGSVGGDVLVAT